MRTQFYKTDPKILFYNIIQLKPSDPYGCRLDYQADSIFHGFRSLFGSNCVDYPKMEHMYKDKFHLVQQDKCRGFSLYNRLEDEKIDRTDIDNKIRTKYFDYIVVPIHHSTGYNKEAIYKIVSPIIHNKIALINGSDSPKYIEYPKVKAYFQREINNYDVDIHPIAFSIPKNNIVHYIPHKELAFAPLIPSYMNQLSYKTYIYNTEEEYNKDYQRSLFGFTWKKAGWDCLRHYEILANGCVPYFVDIHECPVNTLFTFPKRLCKIALGLGGINSQEKTITSDNFNVDAYTSLLLELLDYTRLYLTTEYMAKYVNEIMCNG